MQHSIKTESIKKLSDFNFQWTKTLYKNILCHIAFLFTLFKSSICNKLYKVSPTKRFLWEPRKINFKFHRNWENTSKIVMSNISFCEIWSFWSLSSWASITTFSFELLHRTCYFGGARSKGFAMLRNVSKLTFFDKIGHAKSVGFRFYSAI